MYLQLKTSKSVDFPRFYVQIQMLCEKKKQFRKFVETDFPIVPTKLYVASQVDMAEQTYVGWLRYTAFYGYPVC